MKKNLLLFVFALASTWFVNAQTDNDVSPKMHKLYKCKDSLRQADLRRGLLTNEAFFEKAELIAECQYLGFLG